MPRTLRLSFVVILLAAGRSPVGAADRITLVAKPAVTMAPANVLLRITIEPDAANRAVAIVLDSPDFYRSTEIELEGDRAAHTTVLQFPSLPAGEYEVSATLMGSGGALRASVHQPVHVLGANQRDTE